MCPYNGVADNAQSVTAYGGYVNAIRESAWKVDWEGTIHCHTRLLALHQQLAGPKAQPPELHPHPSVEDDACSFVVHLQSPCIVLYFWHRMRDENMEIDKWIQAQIC